MKIAKSGFTLAEVLITLGIIGVVSALTIPTLIQHYKKQEATARLKKFYSVMSQATLRLENEYGANSRQWAGFGTPYNDETRVKVADDAYDFWNTHYAKYVKSIKVQKGFYNEDDKKVENTKVYFADGTSVTVEGDGRAVTFNFDVNGDRKPNEPCRDQFYFLLATPRTVSNHELSENKSFDVGWLPYLNTRKRALNVAKSANGTSYCTTLLFYDNFEFKDDYPYKL